MSTNDFAELRDGLDRQIDRLEAAIELFQAMVEPGKCGRAGRGLDAVLQDAIEAADRMAVIAAHVANRAVRTATIEVEIPVEPLKK